MIQIQTTRPSSAVTLAVVAAFTLTLTACEKPEPKVLPAKPVRVQRVILTDTAVEESFTGAVRARVETELAFRVGGKIVRRLVDSGQHVAAGEAIAQLDPEDYELAARAAENQYKAAIVEARNAASDEARFHRLMKEGFVSDASHERQKARADAARERVHQARRQLDLARNRASYSILRAPVSGVITSVHFEIGQVVAEGHAIATLAADGDREIVVDIPENRVARLHKARTSATLWASNGAHFAVTLRELSPVASNATRTYRARFRVDGSAPEMRLGMTASIWLQVDNGSSSATLPASALHQQNGQAAVWILDPVASRVELAPVRVISYGQDEVRLAGLPNGALVVTAGTQKVNASLRVTAVDATGKPVNPTTPTAARLARSGG